MHDAGADTSRRPVPARVLTKMLKRRITQEAAKRAWTLVARRRPRRPGTAATAGLGIGLPAPRPSSTTPIAQRLGVDERWIVQRTGIRERRHAAAGRAAERPRRRRRRGAEDAGIDPTDLDLLLVATTSADEITPAGPARRHAIGATNAGAIDVGAACTGFLAALASAAALIEAGRAETVLLIGADALSRYTDSDDQRTAALFGDGAGAVVLRHPEGAGDRPDRPARRRRPATCDHRPPRRPASRWTATTTFKHAVTRMSEATLDASRRRAGARRHRPLRLPPGQPPHPRRRSPSGSSSTRSASSTTSPTSATRPRPRSRSRSSRARGRPLRRAHGARGRDRRRLHLGRGRHRVGGPDRAGPGRGLRARHRRVARASAPPPPGRSPPTAGPSRVNYRSDEAGAEETVADRGGRRQGDRHPGRRHRPRGRRRERSRSSRRSSAAPCSCSSTTPASPPTTSRSSSTTTTGTWSSTPT